MPSRTLTPVRPTSPAPTSAAITLRGRLDVHRLDEVRTALMRVEGPIAVDLADAAYLDQHVLQAMDEEATRRRRSGSSLQVSAASAAVRVILELARRAGIVTDHDTMWAAA